METDEPCVACGSALRSPAPQLTLITPAPRACHTCRAPAAAPQAEREAELHRTLGARCAYLLRLEDFEVVAAPAGGAATHEARLLFPLFERGSAQAVLDRLAPLGRGMDEGDALRIFAQVCVGVAAFHAHSPALAHRDVKPGNVLLGRDGHAALTDFGSAAPARVHVRTRHDALAIQEEAAQYWCVRRRGRLRAGAAADTHAPAPRAAPCPTARLSCSTRRGTP